MIELTETEKTIECTATIANKLEGFGISTLIELYKLDTVDLLSTIKMLRRRNHSLLLQVDKWRVRCRMEEEDNASSTRMAIRYLRERDELRSLQPCGHPKACIASSENGTNYCSWCADIAKRHNVDIDSARRLTG